MPAGRPTLLTEAVVAETPERFAANPFVASFAAALGVDRTTVFGWVRRGRKAHRKVQASAGGPVELLPVDDLCRRFFIALQKALAKIEADALGVVRAGGTGWQARAWELERRFPARYGRGRIVEAELRRMLAEVEKVARERTKAV